MLRLFLEVAVFRIAVKEAVSKVTILSTTAEILKHGRIFVVGF